MTRGRRRPRQRAADIARRQRSSLQQLAFAVVALIMLFLVWNQLAEGAAGCFTTMTRPAGDGAVGHDAPPEDAPDAALPPPLPGTIRLGQPPPPPAQK